MSSPVKIASTRRRSLQPSPRPHGSVDQASHIVEDGMISVGPDASESFRAADREPQDRLIPLVRRWLTAPAQTLADAIAAEIDPAERARDVEPCWGLDRKPQHGHESRAPPAPHALKPCSRRVVGRIEQSICRAAGIAAAAMKRSDGGVPVRQIAIKVNGAL